MNPSIIDCIRTDVSSEGKYVREFENKFAKKVKENYAAVLSGTAALEIAINILNLKK